jgi:hypothetical protein
VLVKDLLKVFGSLNAAPRVQMEKCLVIIWFKLQLCCSSNFVLKSADEASILNWNRAAVVNGIDGCCCVCCFAVSDSSAICCRFEWLVVDGCNGSCDVSL